MLGLTSSLHSAQPQAATPRDPSARTDGPMVAAVAEALGTPLLPWQRLVADVAGERLASGAYRYRVVVVTVPRQSGKTTLMRARLVTRCLAQRNTITMYTAQTGKDARERWEDLVKQITRSPLRSRVTVKRAAGATRLEFYNGSQLRVFSPVENAVHGGTPSEVHIDEAWAFDRVRGNALLGAITPAQITVRDRQLWVVSTAGTATSTFLRDWIDAGRDNAPGVALFSWACPDGADPYDPAVLAAFHPAVGHTQTVDDILSDAGRLSRSEFERAYANRWTRATDAIVSADAWQALAGDQTPPPADALVLGYDVAHDRSSADIVAAWVDDLGRLQWRIVKTGAGDGWVAEQLLELDAQLHPTAVVGDGAGPVRTVNDALADKPQLAGRHQVLAAAEYSSACGEILATIRAGQFGHDGSDRLADAIAAAVTRPLGDLWVWSRTRSKGTISALVAGTAAGYLALHPAAPQAKPFIIVSGAA